MTKTTNLVPVYYDVYEPCEYMPTDRILLAKIPAAAARALAKRVRQTSGTIAAPCMYRVSVEYIQRAHAQFMPTTPNDFDSTHELCISGIGLGLKPMCSTRVWRNNVEGRQCIKQMQRGKCVCPAGRIIATAIWPQLYAKNNEKVK